MVTEAPPEQCRCCQYTFSDREDQVLHYKLDWHLYNVKQSLRKLAVISEEEFSAKCDAEDDLSSLSGSDSEREEIVSSEFLEEAPALTTAVLCSPHIVVQRRNEYVKCLASLLFHPREDLTDEIVQSRVNSITETVKSDLKFCGRLAIFMYSAQHFAGVVYENEKLLLHKTYHRYTVRAKQGTVQGIRDGKGQAPKSLGASLRRYNQIALFNDVEKLILDWGPDLAKCHVIFQRIATYNQSVFTKLKETFLNNSHQKIRSIPLTTYRPTLKETKRVYNILTNFSKSTEDEFESCKKVPTPEPQTKPSQSQKPNPKSIPNSHIKQKKQSDPPKPQVPVKLSWFEEQSHIMFHLIRSITSNNVDSFTKLLNSDTSYCPEITEHTFSVSAQLGNKNTLLHLAAASANPHFVYVLLAEGANPELQNLNNKVPYEVSSSKDHRDEFRRFMAASPDQWNYKLAKVSSPLTPEMEEEQTKKRQEKKKTQRVAKLARDKARKAAERESAKRDEEKLVATTQQLRTKQLTSRERCMLAAEARLATDRGLRGSVSGKCCSCDTGLDGLVPFERLGNKYCSVACVKEHRLRTEA